MFKKLLQTAWGNGDKAKDELHPSTPAINLDEQCKKRKIEKDHILDNAFKMARTEVANVKVAAETFNTNILRDQQKAMSSLSLLRATLDSAKISSKCKAPPVKMKRERVNRRSKNDLKKKNHIDIVGQLINDLDIASLASGLDDEPPFPAEGIKREQDDFYNQYQLGDSLTEQICKFLSSEITNEDRDVPTNCKLGSISEAVAIKEEPDSSVLVKEEPDSSVVVKEEPDSGMRCNGCNERESRFASYSDYIDSEHDEFSVAAPLDGGPIGHWPSPLTEGWLIGSRPGIAEYQARSRARYYGYDYDGEKLKGVVLPHVEFVDAYNGNISPSQECMNLAEEMGDPFKSNGLETFWVYENRSAYLHHLQNNVVIKSFIDGDINTVQFIGLLRSMATELLRPTMYRLSLDFSSTSVKLSEDDAVPYDWKVVKLMLQGNRAQSSLEETPIVRPHSLHSEGNPSNTFFSQFIASNIACVAPTMKYYGRILDVTAAKEYGVLQSLICAIVLPCLIDEILDLGPEERELIDFLRQKGISEMPSEGDRMKAIHCCVCCAIHSISYSFIGGDTSDRSWSPSGIPKSMIHSAIFRAPLTLPSVDATPPFESSRCPELRTVEKDFILLLNPPANGKTPEAKARRAAAGKCIRTIQRKRPRVLCKLGNGVSVTVGSPDSRPGGAYKPSPGNNSMRKSGTLTCQRMTKRTFISIVGSYGRIHLATGRINRVYTAFMDKTRDTLRASSKPSSVQYNSELLERRGGGESKSNKRYLMEKLRRLGVVDNVTSKCGHSDSVSDNIFFAREDSINIFHCKGLYRLFGLVPRSKHMKMFKYSRHLFQMTVNWPRVRIMHDKAARVLTQLLEEINQTGDCHTNIETDVGEKWKISVTDIENVRGQCLNNNNPDIVMADMRRQAASLISHLHKIAIRQHIRTGRIRGAEMSTLWFRPYDKEANVKLAKYEADDKCGQAILVAMVDGGEIESLARDMFPRPARHIMLELLLGQDCALAISALSCKQWCQWSYDMLTRRRNRTYHSAKISDAAKDEACYGLDSDHIINPITFYKYTLLHNNVATKRGRIGLQEIQSMAARCLVGLCNEPVVRSIFLTETGDNM
nr:MAG: wsv226-like protein [Marsupenaeus japonicus pemonivirus]